MSRAAADWTVYFVEEPIYEDGLVEPRVDYSEGAPGVTVAVPVLPAGFLKTKSLAVQEALVDRVMAVHRGMLTVFWYYTPCALEFTSRREPDVTVYDCMDELSAFKGAPPALRDLEGSLFALSDLVFTGGHSLFEAKRRRHPNVHLFPSSVDRNHFNAACGGRLSDPDDQAAVARPRVGFFGVIDERFDIDLVARLADLRPDWNFMLLGPVVKIDADTLPRRRNLHWLGCKGYEELPSYLAHWDAGFMPFAINEATRFISPTKTPEFLAAGLPVVSSPIRDVMHDWSEAGLVEIGRSAEEFAVKLEQVLHGSRADWLADVDRRLAQLSWDDTWRRMSLLLVHELEWRLSWRELSPRLRAKPLSSADAGNV